MATPSVLTVPSMYGDGILYSGPSAYGSELASQPVDLQVDFQSAPSGGVIVDANTFTTSGGGLEGIRSNDPAFTLPAGTAFEIEIRGNTTSNGITLGDLSGSGNEYGSGFGVHRFISLNNRLWIRQNSAGTTTITHLSIRQVTQGSDFEFTRATTGTRINEDGYIEDVPYNLLSYTEELTNVYWNYSSVTVEAQPDIIDPKNGRGVFKVTDTSGGGTSYLLVPSIADANYGRSIYARTVSGTGTVSLLSYYGNTNNLFTLTEQWQRFYVDSVTTTTGQINFYAVDFRAGDLTEVLLYAPQMTKSPDLKPYLPTTDRLNLPRLNYPTYGGCPSLLVEPQRTNIITYSEDATNWSTQSSSVLATANQAISPSGIFNADKLIPANGNVTSNGGRYISFSSTAGTSYSVSVFVKQGEYRYVSFSYGSAAAYGFHFDLQDGIIIQNLDNAAYTAISREAESFGNGWYRLKISLTDTVSVGARFISVRPANEKPTATNNNYATTGDGTSGIYVWGFQMEVGSYTTSYIPTLGSTVTRNEDQVQNAGVGTTDTFNSSEGVLFLESEDIDTSNQDIVGISDGTNNNRVIIINEPNNKIRMFVQAGSSVSTDLTTTSTYTGYNKVAIKYKANDFSTFINGEKILTDNSGNVPSAITKLDLVNPSGASPFYGNLKAVAVYKTALTDTELANLTSYNNHDLFIPYRSRMQMIGADQELQCTEHDITRFL